MIEIFKRFSTLCIRAVDTRASIARSVAIWRQIGDFGGPKNGQNRQFGPFGDFWIAIWLQKIVKVSNLKKSFWQHCRARNQRT